MGDDNYGAALLAMGMRQTQGYDLLRAFSRHQLFPEASKLDRAIAYLRERKLYCLDSPVGRIPPQARPMTLLDKWMKERHK